MRTYPQQSPSDLCTDCSWRSYFMPVILEDVGITGTNQQLLLNALNTVFSFVSGIAGSLTVEKFGRRNLFLWGTFLTGLCYIPINVIAAMAHGHVGQGPGYTFIAFIFLYGIIFSFCCEHFFPLQSRGNAKFSQGLHYKHCILQKSLITRSEPKAWLFRALCPVWRSL